MTMLPLHKALLFSPLLLAALFLPGCKLPPKNTDWQVPYTLQTFPPAYASRALEVADANRDGEITRVEWMNAGGDKRSFDLADTNHDGRVQRTELIRVGSNTKVFDFTRRSADFNKDNHLTPREFRSTGDVEVLRFRF
jgi:hypothetical protein